MAMEVRAGYLGKSGAPQRYVSLHAAGVPPEQSSLWDAELDDMHGARAMGRAAFLARHGLQKEVCIRSTRVHTPAGAAPIRMLPFPAAAHVRTTLI